MSQLTDLEVERDRALRHPRQAPAGHMKKRQATESISVGKVGSQLLRLRAIGPEIASVLSLEAFYRNFNNRREVAAYSGLVPSPWKSGGGSVWKVGE